MLMMNRDLVEQAARELRHHTESYAYLDCRLFAARMRAFIDYGLEQDALARVAGHERTQQSMQELDRMMVLVDKVRALTAPRSPGWELAAEVERYARRVSPTSCPGWNCAQTTAEALGIGPTVQEYCAKCGHPLPQHSMHCVVDRAPTTVQEPPNRKLRWAAGACRRCGYQREDCTCAGGNFHSSLKELEAASEPAHYTPSSMPLSPEFVGTVDDWRRDMAASPGDFRQDDPSPRFGDRLRKWPRDRPLDEVENARALADAIDADRDEIESQLAGERLLRSEDRSDLRAKVEAAVRELTFGDDMLRSCRFLAAVAAIFGEAPAEDEP